MGEYFYLDLDSLATVAQGKSTGPLGVEQILVAIDELTAALEDRPDLIHFFWDLTEAELNLSTDEISRIVTYAQNTTRRREGGRSVYLVSNELSYGIMRMYQAFRARNHDNTGVFMDRDEAMQWLLEGGAIGSIQDQMN